MRLNKRKENGNCMKENTTSIRKSSEESALFSHRNEVMEAALIQSFTATRKKAMENLLQRVPFFGGR